MSDTPRTDEAYEHAVGDPDFFTDEGWRMARTLERELAEAQKDTARLDHLLNGRLLFTYREDIDADMEGQK